jgi:hypothetical protein
MKELGVRNAQTWVIFKRLINDHPRLSLYWDMDPESAAKELEEEIKNFCRLHVLQHPSPDEELVLELLLASADAVDYKAVIHQIKGLPDPALV